MLLCGGLECNEKDKFQGDRVEDICCVCIFLHIDETERVGSGEVL